jgi:hypothetical protein
MPVQSNALPQPGSPDTTLPVASGDATSFLEISTKKSVQLADFNWPRITDEQKMLPQTAEFKRPAAWCRGIFAGQIAQLL